MPFITQLLVHCIALYLHLLSAAVRLRKENLEIPDICSCQCLSRQDVAYFTTQTRKVPAYSWIPLWKIDISLRKF